MAEFLGTPKFQAFDTTTGQPLVGGKVYTYDAGTTTPRATYPTLADAFAGTNANTNPVVLDARGEATIVVSGATKILLVSATGSTASPIWTIDNYSVTTPTIFDSNGNELLKFTSVTSAVNEWTITNAAASTAPRFDVTGGDTNADGYVAAKGTGKLYLDGGDTGDLELNSVSTGTIRLRRATAATSTLTIGTSLTVGTSLTMSDPTSAFTLIPAGTLFDFAGTSVPTGWLVCDGSAVSRTTYATLFAAIGTTWGAGDGTTTFNVPNLQRRITVGKGGSGTATLANTVGATGGAETHTLTESELAAHAHTYLFSTGNIGTAAGGNSCYVATSGNLSTTSTGGGAAHNNMQPSAVVTKMIRAY